MVVYRTPPNANTIAKLVKQKMKVRMADVSIEGRRRGNVTFLNKKNLFAPNVLAVSSMCTLKRSHEAPTIRITKGKL
jgi:hypothetical protein